MGKKTNFSLPLGRDTNKLIGGGGNKRKTCYKKWNVGKYAAKEPQSIEFYALKELECIEFYENIFNGTEDNKMEQIMECKE